MTNYIPPKSVMPEILQGKSLRLEPLAQHHYAGLAALVEDAGGKIFKNSPLGPSFDDYFDKAMAAMKSNDHLPFVLINKKDNATIGMSRLFDIQPANSALEIGYTWYHPDYWGGITNPDAKLTFMAHIFDELGFNRLQLKTDESNAHSRGAMLKMGAKFEGILRECVTKPDGTMRSSAYFSILKNEWPAVKVGLEKRVG